MKIWELEQNQSIQYVDTDGIIWQYNSRGNLINAKDDITDTYTWSVLHKMEFELYKPVDWAKVACDTPILVRDDTHNPWDSWVRRYFAYYDEVECLVYAYYDGKTSWSSYSEASQDWKYAKLVVDSDK